MIYAVRPTMAENWKIRILGIVLFALLTGIAAQVSIPREPVPITGQVLLVLLAGLTLGARDGFMSQVAYLAAIAAGMPIAANGMGAAALAGPTAGYLYAFPLAAGLVGFIAVQNTVWIRAFASVCGVVVIYAIGTAYLKNYLNMSWSAAWAAGVAPFIVFDFIKAAIATTSGEGLRLWWQRQLNQ